MAVRKFFTTGLSFCLILVFSGLLTIKASANQSTFLVAEKTEMIETNFLNLKITKYQSSTPGKKIVIASRNENLFLAVRESDSIHNYIKINEKFELKTQFSIPKEKDSSLYVLDLEVYERYFLVSVVEYFADPKKCSTMKVYELNEKKEFVLKFRSTPCLGGVGEWSEIAGRIAVDEISKVAYITGGNILTDLYRNQFPRPGICCMDNSYKLAIQKTNLYGSVISLDLISSKTSKISSGHRGPQGIEFDQEKRIIYESEHGPRGGDELNIINKGKDYGWPFVSLGEAYYRDFKIPNPGFGKPVITNSHSGFTAPIFSWTPSVAPSQILLVRKNSIFYNQWSNSLLVTTLKDRSIRRLKLSDDGRRVLYDERIEIGHRIRDIESLSDGFLLSTDDGYLIEISLDNTQIGGGTFPLNQN
jgi:hypothetical protein